MREPFVKLFSSITDSTIWMEDSDTRIVWVTLLAMCDPRGYVAASIPGIAARARVSLEAAEKALQRFMAPDPYSRSQEHEGRRLAAVDRGFHVLNYQRYREMRNADVRREQNRDAQATYRAKHPRPKVKTKVKTKERREIEAHDAAAGNLAPATVYDLDEQERR